MPRASVAFVAVLVLSFALAGCISKDKPNDESKAKVNVTPPTRNITLPDRQGECLGCKETNKTENGTGGIQHLHDYWHGKEQVVVFEEDISFFPDPLFPDGEGSNPKSVQYLKLHSENGTAPTLVYEGTEKMSVLLKAPAMAGTAIPDPPAVSFQYRSAADAAWRAPVPLAYGTPLEIKIKPEETDMPHSISSLWVFRLTTDKPDANGGYNLTMTIYKGHDVVNWPGHPNLYADSNVRKVADNKHVKTHMTGIAGSQLYDQGGTWASPDKLISWGTSKLVVFVNVTKISSQTGQAATGYFLEVHNATIIGPEVVFGDRYGDQKNDLKSYTFEVPVDGAGMDGPYQPSSRWGFRAMATFADIDGVVGLCPGCFDYDIEYDLTVFAIHEEGAAGTTM